jgi:uncharacterized protein (TIGR02600 family)
LQAPFDQIQFAYLSLNTFRHISGFNLGRRSLKRGMALLSVLIILVAIALLVVAFLGRTISIRSGAANYQATVRSRLLADTVVSIIQAQINEATTKTAGTGFVWASQPGAIRLFDNTGALNNIYRLYSAPSRTTPNLSDLATDLPASTSAWTSAPARWVDLNTSAMDDKGNLHFPILDPRSPSLAANLPGVFGTAGNHLVIPGFSIAPTAPYTSTQMAPMPVQWLYVLKNGAVIPPDTTSTGTVLTFKMADVMPSSANPIVGRIAYWTDDETSKVNINTAAGDDVLRSGAATPNFYPSNSIFWATPMFCSPDEVGLSLYQPMQGEFQRYPGHPGTVALNSLLSHLCGLTTSPFSYSDFYSLLPRYSGGASVAPGKHAAGSKSATVSVQTGTGTQVPVIPNGSRLYTSVAEMLFAANDPSTGAAVTSRTASQLTMDATDPIAAVERSNFFLTAHSRAPELNLWGEPRVSVWPVANNAAYRSPEDKLLAYDATVEIAAGPEPYYFQRGVETSGAYNAANKGSDATLPSNIQILNYLDALTSSNIPGFGGNFTTDKYSNTPASPSVTPAMRQILTEVFDYIRTINLTDPYFSLGTTTYGKSASLRAPSGGPPYVDGVYQVVPSANNTGAGSDAGSTTLKNLGLNGWGTQGNAAYPVLVEATVQFVAMGLGKDTVNLTNAGAENPIPAGQYGNTNIAHDQNATSMPTITNPTAPLSGDVIIDDSASLGGTGLPGAGRPADNGTAMEEFLLLTFFNPAIENSFSNPAFSVSVGGLNTFGVTVATGAIPLHFPGNSSPPESTSSMVLNTDLADDQNSQNSFGIIPPMFMTGYIGYGGSGVWAGASQKTYNTSNGFMRTNPFYSQLFVVPGQTPSAAVPSTGASGWNGTLTGSPAVPGISQDGKSPANGTPTFGFNGGTISVTVNDAHTDGQAMPGNSITSYTIDFPSATFPIPKIPYGSQTGGYPPPGWVSGPGNPYSGGGRVIGSGSFSGTNYWPDLNDRWCYVNTSPYAAATIRVDPNDVVQSMVLSPKWSDARDLALASVPPAAFSAHPLYGTATNMAHNLFVDNWDTVIGNTNPSYFARLIKNAGYSTFGSPAGAARYHFPLGPPELNGALTTLGGPGDWDNGFGAEPDGAYVNKADEGSLPPYASPANYEPYYAKGVSFANNVVASFSPNRMIPSPGMFGSLPTGVDAKNPKAWQTLLFQPGSGAGGAGISHPGEKNQPSVGDPPDHLLLDLFWMPQAEPYPISEPYSTAGKINLNYEIQPFTYITRATALRSLFAGEEVAIMPDSLAGNYKNDYSGDTGYGNTTANPPPANRKLLVTAMGGTDPNGDSRLPIDPDATLGLSFSVAGGSSAKDTYNSTDFTSTKDPHATSDPQTGASAWYDSVANQVRFFKSASEICEMFLVPQGYTWNQFSGASFNAHSWYKIPGGDFALVGDNTREKPYTDIYSRVTTRSNTFTVYYTVQSLNNAQPKNDTAQATWNESIGAVTGEYRGSTTLERYLDPDETMPDFQATGAAGTASLESYYKWRVLETHQFAP